MKNPFKKFKVVKEATVIYDTYQEGSYTRNKSVKVPTGTIIYGDKITKDGKELISFGAAELGVDEEIQIAAENCEKQTPWGIIAGIVLIVIGGIVYIVKRK